MGMIKPGPKTPRPNMEIPGQTLGFRSSPTIKNNDIQTLQKCDYCSGWKKPGQSCEGCGSRK